MQTAAEPRSPAPLDAPSPEQIEAWRRMGPAGRSALAARVLRQAYAFKRASLAAQHPEWTPTQVQQATARHFLHGRT